MLLLMDFVLTVTWAQISLSRMRTSETDYKERTSHQAGATALAHRSLCVRHCLIYRCICIITILYNALYKYFKSKKFVLQCQKVVEL